MKLKSILIATIAALTIASCQNAPKEDAYRRHTGFVFGTSYSFIYKSKTDLYKQILDSLAIYDASLSFFNPNSLLSQLNDADSIVADAHLLRVIQVAKDFHKSSNGAFDITIGPLSQLWRFTKDLHNDTISVQQWDSIGAKLDSVKPLVGLDKITIDGNVVRKADRRMKINASAIAEGYGIDIAAAVLDSLGVTDYMVEIGGEIHCKGLNPKGKKWRVGIDCPNENSTIINRKNKRVIEVSDCAVSTSGSYRQCYHVADGRRIQHTIDPRTGYPVCHSMESVTVVGQSTAITDVLCTILMVIGPDSALQKIGSYPNVEAYIIYRDADGNQQEQMTDGFRLYLDEQ